MQLVLDEGADAVMHGGDYDYNHDPEAWEEVTRSVGGLGETLETIRRRIWVPLCAPRYLLDELGAERVKGLLLYGPPGCGKSHLASRRTAISRPHLGDISTTPR